MIQAPWYLCQRLWSGNRSSCQTGTFCPDIKCLSAGHRCNLLAQTFTLTIRYFFASHVHVKRESETYFVWVTHLCWPPWITYDTGHLSLITGKDRIDVCLIRKLKKNKKTIAQSLVLSVKPDCVPTWLGWDFFLSYFVSQSLGLSIGESCSTGFNLTSKRSVFMLKKQTREDRTETETSSSYSRKATDTAL